jgi:glutaredoxin 3
MANLASLPKDPKQANVEVYTKDYCPYCVAAINLLTQKGVGFVEYDVTRDAEKHKEMLERATPRRTVPQIFVGGVGLGGFDDIKKLDQEQKLEAILFPNGR